MKNYRRSALILSFVFLALAFATKYYSGPYWQFSDAYLGDVFIVAVLYYWLGAIFLKWRPFAKAATIFCIALAVELFQASGIPASWNLPEPFVFVLGSQFDVKDFLFYAIGIALAVWVDYRFLKKRERNARFF